MTICRIILQSIRRSSSLSTTITSSPVAATQLIHHQFRSQEPHFLLQSRSFAFSSAEEAAAERRRRKRRLRIEPPLLALRRDPNAPRPPPDPNAPRLPDSTSALVGPRLNLHNRVQSLIRAGDLNNASIIARQSVFSNTRPTVFTCNAIMAAMYRAKRYDDSVALFQYFYKQSNIVPNVVSYNVLINTHCDAGRVDTALEFYRYILENAPFSPSHVTYRHLTKGLIEAGRIQEAVELLCEMLSKGHGADSLVYNNLISGFLNLGNLEKANELFDELKERCLVYDGVVNATFMDWFFNQGKEKEAMESYKSLLDRQFKMIPATCNVLIEVLLKHNKKKEAMAMFENMLDIHTPPVFQGVSSETFNIMVNECFKLGKISEALETFRKAGKKVGSKPFSMDVAGYNNMIIRCCEHDMVDEAEKMYLEICSKSLCPDVTSYRTLIDAYFKLGRIEDALNKYSKMVEAGLRVIPDYANKWFSLLIENGKVLECAPILTKMAEKDPKPDIATYDVVIRGLCNEGNFDVSLDLLRQMMSYNIGINPTMKEFVKEVFGNVGRVEEVEKVFATRNPVQGQGNSYYRRPPMQGSPVMGGSFLGQSQSQMPGRNPQYPGPVQGQPQIQQQLNGYSESQSQLPGQNPQYPGAVQGQPQIQQQLNGYSESQSQLPGQNPQYPGAVQGQPQIQQQLNGYSESQSQLPGQNPQYPGPVQGQPQTQQQFNGYSQSESQSQSQMPGRNPQYPGPVQGQPQIQQQFNGYSQSESQSQSQMPGRNPQYPGPVQGQPQHQQHFNGYSQSRMPGPAQGQPQMQQQLNGYSQSQSHMPGQNPQYTGPEQGQTQMQQQQSHGYYTQGRLGQQSHAEGTIHGNPKWIPEVGSRDTTYN